MPEKPATRRLQRAFGLLLLLAASVGITLGAVELLLRAGLIPNEYRAQNKVTGARGGNGPLLFILGDSFMAPLRGGDLADYLADAVGTRGLRIRNTATAGTGPVEYLDRLRRHGTRWQPDLILLSWYVGNDLQNVGCGGNLEARLLPPRPIPLWKRSYLVQFVMARLRVMYPDRVIFQSAAPAGHRAGPVLLRLLAPRPLSAAVAAGRDLRQEVDYEAMRRAGIPEEHIEAARAGRVNPWVVSLGAQYPDYLRDALLVRSDCARRSWQDAQRVLDLILEEAARLETPVLPVVFPHALQVTQAHAALYRAWRINIDDEMFRSDRPQQLLREYFRAHGIETVDLLPALRASAEMLYYEQDEHLNMRGQQLAAGVIAEAVLRRAERDQGP